MKGLTKAVCWHLLACLPCAAAPLCPRARPGPARPCPRGGCGSGRPRLPAASPPRRGGAQTPGSCGVPARLLPCFLSWFLPRFLSWFLPRLLPGFLPRLLPRLRSAARRCGRHEAAAGRRNRASERRRAKGQPGARRGKQGRKDNHKISLTCVS